MEELNSVPGSLACVQALNFWFLLDMEEKQFWSPNISSLVGSCSTKGKRNCVLYILVLIEGSVWGFILISFYMLFSDKLKHPLPRTQLSSPCQWLHVLQSLVQVLWPVLAVASWLSPPWVYHKHVKVNSPKPTSLVPSNDITRLLFSPLSWKLKLRVSSWLLLQPLSHLN